MKESAIYHKSKKLGVLLPGMGAVATTLIAGVYAIKKGLGVPVGSFTQLGFDAHGTPVRDRLDLVSIDDLVFGGWDIHGENVYETAKRSRVLESDLLRQLEAELSSIKPMPAVFDQRYVKRLEAKEQKQGASWWDLAQQIKDDIAQFKIHHGLERCVMVWCGSTEVFIEEGSSHTSVRRLEEAMKMNDPSITPSMVYAYAALTSGIPYANGSPNLSVDIPAMSELARECGIPIAGKDFKTGQTMIKTVLAPAFRARTLGLSGWFSTNILGNRDGEVLDDPESFKTKEMSKLSVLETILDAEKSPELYGDISHSVRINYYPPRGDNKEGWDSIDIFGWLGYPMQIKVDFLCRDSILAAPIVLDLILLLDIAARKGERGTLEWMSFFFKAPMTQGTPAVHDLFAQESMLREAVDRLAR